LISEAPEILGLSVRKSIMEKDLVIYWAPNYEQNDIDWNMLYQEPINLLDDLKSKRDPDSREDNYLYCPAFKDFTKNIFVFKNNLKSEFYFDKIGRLHAVGDNYISASNARPNNIMNSKMLEMTLGWMVFSEESVMAEFTPPYFTQAKHMQYGSLIPGAFDIGSWFRPYNAEIQLWPGVERFVLEEDDPIFYLKINTDRNVVLKKFVMTKELKELANGCITSPKIFGRFWTLPERYKTFKNSKTNEKILNIIKKQLTE
jgi:hypothetical protein